MRRSRGPARRTQQEPLMLTAFQKQKLPRLFAVHDLNRDGVINRIDFEEYTRRIGFTAILFPAAETAETQKVHRCAAWSRLLVVSVLVFFGLSNSKHRFALIVFARSGTTTLNVGRSPCMIDRSIWI
jgi:hypothetical protein